MLKNYFKTAFRSLFRNKGYTAINITGLAVGVSVCLVIFLVIQYELSFDKFHQNKARIYRVLTKPEREDSTAAVPFPLPTALKNDFPQLQSAGIYSTPNMQILVMGKDGQPEKKFKEKTGVFFTETSFFSIFSFPWIAGNPKEAMQNANSAVLTKETAEKYFGNWKNAIGKSLKVDNHFLVTVTGILANVPANTDFNLSVVIPYSLPQFSKSTDWATINSAHGCYVLLPPGVTASSVDRQLLGFSKKYRARDNKNIQVLQSLTKVHYDSGAGNFSGKMITAERIRTLWLIAAFILIIACVNFVNLSTAQAVNRAKEIGVRKVLGSNRLQLKTQFLLETLLLTLMSILFAVIIAALGIYPVSKILDIPLSLDLLHNSFALFFLFVITFTITFLAGFYPSLVLSRFNPVTALKSVASAKSTKGISLRRALVVFQFIIAQALIIGTLLIVRQMDYFKNNPIGFNKDAVVNVPFQGDSAGISKLSYLHNKLLDVKGIKQVSFNSAPPADDDNWWTGFRFNHMAKETDFASINKWVDAGYLKTYQLPLVAGRDITTSDSTTEFLINEILANKLGFTNPRDVLNKEINVWNGFAKGPIVGVVQNFHNSPLKDSLAPVFMANLKKAFSQASIKVTPYNLSATMQTIEKIWNETYPDYVFEYQFLDDKIANFYKEETQLSQLYKIFAVIAIFLSCLGLYGLASFMAVQRTKEVGIRKVLGATAGNIVYLFSREFILLIGLAFVIATPITWYFMNQWLQSYVYRITISWWVFIGGGITAVLIALITVSFQAIKAAIANPVKSLRSE